MYCSSFLNLFEFRETSVGLVGTKDVWREEDEHFLVFSCFFLSEGNTVITHLNHTTHSRSVKLSSPLQTRTRGQMPPHGVWPKSCKRSSVCLFVGSFKMSRQVSANFVGNFGWWERAALGCTSSRLREVQLPQTAGGAKHEQLF